MSSVEDVFANTEHYEKFYDYLSKKYAKTLQNNGSYRELLKELEESIYTLLLMIVSEDEEGDLGSEVAMEGKEDISMLYDTLKVLVILYNDVLTSAKVMEKEKGLQKSGEDLEEEGTEKQVRSTSPIHVQEDLIPQEDDFYGQTLNSPIGVDLGLQYDINRQVISGSDGLIQGLSNDNYSAQGIYQDIENGISGNVVLNHQETSTPNASNNDARALMNEKAQQAKNKTYDLEMNENVDSRRRQVDQGMQTNISAVIDSSMDLGYMVPESRQTTSATPHMGLSMSQNTALSPEQITSTDQQSYYSPQAASPTQDTPRTQPRVSSQLSSEPMQIQDVGIQLMSPALQVNTTSNATSSLVTSSPTHSLPLNKTMPMLSQPTLPPPGQQYRYYQTNSNSLLSNSMTNNAMNPTPMSGSTLNSTMPSAPLSHNPLSASPTNNALSSNTFANTPISNNLPQTSLLTNNSTNPLSNSSLTGHQSQHGLSNDFSLGMYPYFQQQPRDTSNSSYDSLSHASNSTHTSYYQPSNQPSQTYPYGPRLSQQSQTPSMREYYRQSIPETDFTTPQQPSYNVANNQRSYYDNAYQNQPYYYQPNSGHSNSGYGKGSSSSHPPGAQKITQQHQQLGRQPRISQHLPPLPFSGGNSSTGANQSTQQSSSGNGTGQYQGFLLDYNSQSGDTDYS